MTLVSLFLASCGLWLLIIAVACWGMGYAALHTLFIAGIVLAVSVYVLYIGTDTTGR